MERNEKLEAAFRDALSDNTALVIKHQAERMRAETWRILAIAGWITAATIAVLMLA